MIDEMTDENEINGVESTVIREDVATSPDGGQAVKPPKIDRLVVIGCLITLAVVLLPVLAWHVFIGGWPMNYGAPVRGRVIDERTGKPVAGAVVVGEWYTAAFMGAHHRMHASEAVTNAKGEYFLPGMPLKIRRIWDYYRSDEPLISIYKPGYGMTSADNRLLERSGNRPYSLAMKRVSYWDGKDLPLLPVDDIKSEAKSLASIHDIAQWPYTLHPRRYPHLWSAILQGARRIPKGQFGSGIADPRNSYEYYMRNDE